LRYYAHYYQKRGFASKKPESIKSLWFVESYGLVPQYLKLESTDGQTVKVDFNPSSSKSSYQDLSEEERQKIKDLAV
jgi:serine protease inhibitor